MSDELFDPDGLLEPMTKKPQHVRLREVQAVLAAEAKSRRDAWLASAVETMRRAN